MIMDEDIIWEINIQKSFKNLEALRDVFMKSEEGRSKFKPVMSDFGALFTALSGSMPDPSYRQYAQVINDKVNKYNDNGDNFKLKQNASYFANRVSSLEWPEAARFISEINAKDGYKFQTMLKEHGYFVDRADEERKKKEEEEKRRKLEEEKRRKMTSIEVRPTPKTLKVAYCTVCGAKFSNNEFVYCTQCGAQRHTYTVA